ncbi:hypothetical protein EGK75_01230 [Neisseria weixii]|uniref:Uncharacterized protein n=1 Tax=Neisseria weixii TaxID=1853276 RepID=A0A3N4N2S9_9NEIS|nr:hypothetical protein [Neisseria weixii]RPD90492.1 hypothetical protein EGK74_01715 [Neisseria weixii]RPD90566.1 hypothetical protein EGK75_01230 [Neisseria weixii]
MNQETHLIRIDINQTADGLYGCQVNSHGDLLLELAPTYRDKLTAVKAALRYLTDNDLQTIMPEVV